MSRIVFGLTLISDAGPLHKKKGSLLASEEKYLSWKTLR